VGSPCLRSNEGATRIGMARKSFQWRDDADTQQAASPIIESGPDDPQADRRPPAHQPRNEVCPDLSGRGISHRLASVLFPVAHLRSRGRHWLERQRTRHRRVAGRRHPARRRRPMSVLAHVITCSVPGRACVGVAGGPRPPAPCPMRNPSPPMCRTSRPWCGRSALVRTRSSRPTPWTVRHPAPALVRPPPGSHQPCRHASPSRCPTAMAASQPVPRHDTKNKKVRRHGSSSKGSPFAPYSPAVSSAYVFGELCLVVQGRDRWRR